MTAPPSMPGVFDPNTAIAAPTYDSFGLPTGMGEQPIYVGYIPHITQAQSYGGQYSDKQTNISNSEVTVKDLMQHYHDQAVSPNRASRTAWAQTQMQLQAMNAYGADTRVNYGAWDGKKDSQALQDAINGWLQGGDATKMMTFEEYVRQQAAQGAANGLDQNQPGGPGNGKGSGFKATSPAEIQMQGDQESQGMLGHAFNAGDSSSLVGAVQGAQQDAFNQGDVYLRSVTPQSVARQYILEHNLPEYAQHQAEGYMNVFANMFLQGQSSRANTSLGDAAVGG